MSSAHGIRSLLSRGLAILLGALLLVLPAAPVWAGPVDWQEVAATSEGRQWWDAGSLRVNRNGNLTVLSRFQPAPPDDQARNPDCSEARPPASDLYVMEIDCGQNLYHNTSINGLPHWSRRWQAAGDDDLISSTINAVCAAGNSLLAGF